ncbi:MAG: hypothetical protein HFF10_12125 [Angelakisella sp.]|jgi:hypothetical protein|nr:hypothetical protein [Angelakisella sp.]
MEKEQELLERQSPEEEATPIEEAAPPEAAPVEETPAQKLAACILATTREAHVTPLKKLKLHLPEGVTPEEAEELLTKAGTPEADPALEKIAFIRGKKDLYFYETTLMTAHFAELDSLIMDKDILRTIATVTRSDCKLYPRPTQFSKLMGYPFYFSEDEIEGAAARMEKLEEYADIGVVTASNGGKGFYSTQFISRGYAQGLIESVEVEERENP